MIVLAAMSTTLIALVYFSDFIRNNPSASPSATMAISREAQPREREDFTRLATANASGWAPLPM